MKPAETDTRVCRSIGEIAPDAWDACACPEVRQDGGRPVDPFSTHRFLLALEESGSVGPGTGWQPLHLAVWRGDELIAVSPTYAKEHSHGEYIFDFAWADAYARAGGAYYPKLQIAVPFTPVAGRRLLARPGDETTGRAALLAGAVGLAAENGLSSLHITFCTRDEAETGAEAGLLHRTGLQYHWHNEGYDRFEDFLSALSSRKRKAIRKERARAQNFGGTIHMFSGDEISSGHWDAFWRFYQDTGTRKWGRPYLSRVFFDLIHETMREDVLLIMARRDGNWVAGALNFIGREALFGRYWGCTEDHPFLHFELCYHQAVEYAISAGFSRVEAGAQGAHKIARGYRPVPVHSLHWINDPGFREAVADFLVAEREAVAAEIMALDRHAPYRKG